MLGIAIGWAFAALVTDAEVRLIVGIVALVFTLDYFFRRKGRSAPRPHNPPKAWFWGAVSGFTSFVSHSGGPPMQMYLLPLRLDPKLLAGTTVLLFAIVNFVKLVPYAMLGQFSTDAPRRLRRAPAACAGFHLARRAAGARRGDRDVLPHQLLGAVPDRHKAPVGRHCRASL